jgi:hypothetical protein
MAGFLKKIKDKLSDKSDKSNKINNSNVSTLNTLDNTKPSQNRQEIPKKTIIDYDKILNESKNNGNNNIKLKIDLPKDFLYGTTLTNDNFEITESTADTYKNCKELNEFYIKDKNLNVGITITTINSNLKETADIVFNYCNRLNQVNHFFTLFNRNELLKNPNLLNVLEANAKVDAFLNKNSYMQSKLRENTTIYENLITEKENAIKKLNIKNNETNENFIEDDIEKNTEDSNFVEYNDESNEPKFNIEVINESIFLIRDKNDQFASVSLEKCDPILLNKYISTKNDINEVTKELDKISEYCTSSNTERTQKIIDFIKHEENEKEGEISKNSNETKENEINREVYEEGDIVVLTPQEYEPNYLENHTEAEIKAEQNKYYLLDYSTGEVVSLTTLSYSKDELQTLANDSDSIEDIKEVVEEYEASLHDEFDMSDLSQENTKNILENALGDFEEFDDLENYTDLDDLDDYEDRDM